jgi:hypothetical protein
MTARIMTRDSKFVREHEAAGGYEHENEQFSGVEMNPYLERTRNSSRSHKRIKNLIKIQFALINLQQRATIATMQLLLTRCPHSK